MRNTRALVATTLLLIACGAHEPGPVSSPREQSRAKVRFDREVLTAALDSLDQWHARGDTGWRPAPGSRRDAIEALFEDTSFAVPEELLIVWGRHDGAMDTVPYVGPFVLLSSEQARATFDALRADPDASWRHNWIPLLRSGSGIVAVDASRSESPAGPLVGWFPPSPPRVIATNLTHHLGAWIEAIGDGSVGLDGSLHVDPEELMRLHQSRNDDLPGPWIFPEARAPR